MCYLIYNQVVFTIGLYINMLSYLLWCYYFFFSEMYENAFSTIDLTPYGLSENQSMLYQTWLQMGTRAVTPLARQSGMHRVLTYNTLQELCKMWLCTCMTLGNTGYYSMLEPKMLRNKLQEKVQVFDMLLPSLEWLIKYSGDGFKVQTYQWLEWMKTLYDHLVHSTTNFKSFLWADHIDPVFRAYLYDIYLPKRLAKWIKSSAIVSKTEHNANFADQEKVPLTAVVMIDDPLFDLSSEIVLFDNEKILVASLSSTEMSWLLIQSKNLYTTLEQIFDLLWRTHGWKKQK